MNRLSLFLTVFLGFSGVFQLVAMDAAAAGPAPISAVYEVHASLYRQLKAQLALADTASEDIEVLFCDFVDKTYLVIKNLSKRSGLTLDEKQDFFNRTIDFFQDIMQLIDKITLNKDNKHHCVLQMRQIYLLIDIYNRVIVQELSCLDGEEASIAEDADRVDIVLPFDEGDELSDGSNARTSASVASIKAFGASVGDESVAETTLSSRALVGEAVEHTEAAHMKRSASLPMLPTTTYDKFVADMDARAAAQRRIKILKTCVYAQRIINACRKPVKKPVVQEQFVLSADFLEEVERSEKIQKTIIDLSSYKEYVRALVDKLRVIFLA